MDAEIEKVEDEYLERYRTLIANQEALEAEIQVVTEAPAYEAKLKKLAEIQRDIVLLENKSRKIRDERKQAEKDKALHDHQERLGKINGLKVEIEAADVLLFETLDKFFDTVSVHYDLSVRLARLADEDIQASRTTGYFVPSQKERVKVIGVPYDTGLREIALDLVNRYFVQWARRIDRLRAGDSIKEPVPSYKTMSTRGVINFTADGLVE